MNHSNTVLSRIRWCIKEPLKWISKLGFENFPQSPVDSEIRLRNVARSTNAVSVCCAWLSNLHGSKHNRSGKCWSWKKFYSKKRETQLYIKAACLLFFYGTRKCVCRWGGGEPSRRIQAWEEKQKHRLQLRKKILRFYLFKFRRLSSFVRKLLLIIKLSWLCLHSIVETATERRITFYQHWF